MSKQKTLKIKKPKLGGAMGVVILSAVLSCCLGVLMYFVVSYYSNPEHTLSIDFLGINADFFRTADKPSEIEGMDNLTADNPFFQFGTGREDKKSSLPGKKPVDSTKKEEAQRRIETAKQQAQEKALEAKRKSEAQKALKQQQEFAIRGNIKLSSHDPNKNIIPVEAFTIVDFTQLLNETRRGMVEISLVGDLTGVSLSGKEKDVIREHLFWREQSTQASKPINMTRVLHVAKHIPAILENRINSQLPGKIIAQISENVFGGHGRTILIPAGTKAVGRYFPIQKQGQERILCVWTRFITPQGVNIHVGNAEMSDSMGRSGITGKVDNRFFDRYGMSMFTSIINALSLYSVPVTSRQEGLALQAATNSFADITEKILDSTLQLKPIVHVPQGTKIFIEPKSDILFQGISKNKGKASRIAL